MTKLSRTVRAVLIGGTLISLPTLSAAQEDILRPPGEDVQVPAEAEAAARLLAFVSEIDESADLQANGAIFEVEDVQLRLVFDLNADRMRVMTPVAPVSEITPDELFRLMQANFDSALDARYAIAQDAVWSTFIHPLSSLTTEDFASGIAQAVNLVKTYGSSYSSGALVFGEGDSADEQRRLVDELIEKGREI
ncbi:MAG: type III secretion system chaperone [Pseudomonadota bacterium]